MTPKLFILENNNHFKLNDYILIEGLLLKRAGDKLVAVSDAADRKGQSAETFRNKDRLKASGFKWNPTLNSWAIDTHRLQHAQEVLALINKKPIEKFIDKIEEIPEFLENTDNLSRKDELGQQIEKYVDELSLAVDATTQSEKVKQFLEFYAKFHGYSFYNTMLIYLQRRDATHVAGFKQWEEKFHRKVKKGAKSITILAPIKRKEEVPNQPAGTGGDEADVDAGTKQRQFVRFMAVSVFDISDTEPMDERGAIPDKLQWHGKNDASELADEICLCAEQICNEMGIKVTNVDTTRGEKGFSAGGHINLSSDIAGAAKASTFIHEIAHELLHSRGQFKSYIGDDEDSNDLSREIRELQAESVSYVVLKYYNLPVEHHAIYLSMWKANKDSIKRNLDIIKKAADFIIKRINAIRKEIKPAETEPQTVA